MLHVKIIFTISFLFFLRCYVLGFYTEQVHLINDYSVVYDEGLCKDEVTEITQKHNDLRKLLFNGKVPNQPRAVKFRPVDWDEDLAEAAQIMANTLKHQHFRVLDSRFSLVGQNSAVNVSRVVVKAPHWNSVIYDWFREYKNYTYPKKAKQSSKYYTQIVWAATRFIGCGYAHYFNTTNVSYYKLYICLYGPGGNVAGEQPYLSK